MTEKNDQHGDKTVLKSTIWYTIGNVIAKGINYFTIPIFTKLLSTGEFGDYNNFLAWLNVVTIVATLSLSTSLVRGRFEYKAVLNTYIKSILVLSTLFSGILFLLVLAFRDFFVSLFSMPFEYIVLMFVYVGLFSAFDVYQNMQRYEYKYKAFLVVSLFSAIASIVFSLFLMYFMEDKLKARLVGAYIPLIAISLLLYLMYFIKGNKIDISHWSYALKICIPYVPHLLAMTILSSMDRIMIKNICGSEAAAYYSLAYTCALAVQVIWMSYNSAFGPWLHEKLNEKDYLPIIKASEKYVLFFTIPVIGILLISPELIRILGGSAYLQSIYVMPPVIAGCFFQFIYSMYVNIEQFEKKTVLMAAASGTAAALNFVLNALFIPLYGYIAAAYTTLVGYICLFILHYFIVRRMNLAKVYNTRFILLLSVIVVLASIAVNWLYPMQLVRYGVLLLYIVIIGIYAYKNRQLIIDLIKRR